ncbi:hypothetical protein ZHAS_00013540 [Anopheles sinensis]|uniref:Uncharacterized protein n=1 Tax=Anopheles sinensis TaxID=74873 RepID=A0A084W636_ANOSI|nr:hypothetical protein ZHAS_00013540 [Anopheles sinensis]
MKGPLGRTEPDAVAKARRHNNMWTGSAKTDPNKRDRSCKVPRRCKKGPFEGRSAVRQGSSLQVQLQSICNQSHSVVRFGASPPV